MHLLLILFGALCGAGASDSSLFGAVLGGFLGGVLARQNALIGQIAELRGRVDLLRAQQVVRTPPEPLARPVETPPAATEPDSAPPPSRPEPVDTRPRTVPLPQAPGSVWTPDRTAPARARADMDVAVNAGSDVHGRIDDTGPSIDERIAALLKRWFTEGNVPVKVGMLVLFVGVGALLKYAVEQGMVALPIELRLGAVAAAAIGALGFGWRQRGARPVFALALQGGALGVLLLTVFAGYAYWDVLPAGLAFALVLVLVAGSAALALLQHAMALAVLGSIGGFLAPVLISTGSGNHVGLFGYYALLNLTVFAIAWVRPWRVLNLVGFAFTFAIGTLWGWRYYRPEHFATTEPFLLLFFLFYVAIAVLYALRQPTARRGLVDGTLVFGTPLLAFALQAALLEDNDMALAWSALAVAALYGGLAGALFRRDGLRTLAMSFAALSLGFATLAVPLALSASWTAATWALEGAALVWLGLRQAQRLPVASGLLLQLLAGAAWIVALDGDFMRDLAPAFGNGRFLGAVLLTATALFSGWLLERAGQWPRIGWVAHIAGLGWWTLGGLREIDRLGDRSGGLLGWLAVTALLFAALRMLLRWDRPAWALLGTIGWTTLLALSVSDSRLAPLHGVAAWTWPLWFAAAGVALYALREPQARGISIAHVASLGSIALIAALELHARVRHLLQLDGGWAQAAAMLPWAALLWASWRHPQWAARPLADRFDAYRLRWFAPASLALALWWLLSLASAGDPAPLPFVPLLNPLELGQVLVIALVFALWREQGDDEQRGWLPLAIGGMTFASISAATLRAVHHLAGLGWNDALWRSMLAQTSLTVVWSVLGVTAWIVGSKRGSRPVWLAGALLMAVVLGKLIVVDRSHMGNMPGIVSFLAVGLLLTVVGYLAPSPPRSTAEAS